VHDGLADVSLLDLDPVTRPPLANRSAPAFARAMSTATARAEH
jgi:hypothetical protein